jgi:hypothetical protein
MLVQSIYDLESKRSSGIRTRSLSSRTVEETEVLMEQEPSESTSMSSKTQRLVQPLVALKGWLDRQDREHNFYSIAALVLGLVGAALLARSFVTTEADIVVVTGTALERGGPVPMQPFVAFCAEGLMITEAFTDSTGSVGVLGPCPAGTEHPVAVITRDSRRLFAAGWVALVVSTFWQAWIMRRPRLLLRSAPPKRCP